MYIYIHIYGKHSAKCFIFKPDNNPKNKILLLNPILKTWAKRLSHVRSAKAGMLTKASEFKALNQSIVGRERL